MDPITARFLELGHPNKGPSWVSHLPPPYYPPPTRFPLAEAGVRAEPCELRGTKRAISIEEGVLGEPMNISWNMGGCQNSGPFLGPLNTRCRIVLRTQKRDHTFDNHPYIQVALG